MRRAARPVALACFYCRSRLLPAGALILAGAGCRKTPNSPNTSGPAGPAVAAGATMGLAPVFRADSAGIHRYLETVDTVRGATVAVTWSPNTVRLSREQTLRSLRRVARDGATFTFAADDPAIAGVKPGQVLLVWGIALRKVKSVERAGSSLIVKTDVASLPEAIPNGTIVWRSRANFGQGMVSPSRPPPADTTRHASGNRARRLVFYAAYRGGDRQGEGAGGDSAEGDDDAEAELPNHAEGEIGGYEFEVGYGNNGNRLDFELDARKGEAGPFAESQKEQGKRTRAHGTDQVGANGGFTGEEHGAALTKEEQKQKKEHKEQEENTKQGVNKPETPGDILTRKGLFGMAAEVFDLRVKVRGHLDDFATDGSITLANASLGNFKATIQNLNGEADLDWIARLGEKGVFSEKVKLEIPFNYDIPLIIAGLPFMIEVGANLLVTPGLTSHFASATGSYHITFNGTAGISATGTDVQTQSSLTGKIQDGKRQITSLGVSAILVAAQVPRVGFGLGLLNTSAVAYVDHVLATSIVSEGSLGMIPCRRFQIVSTFGAGVGVQILGIPVPGLGSKRVLKEPLNRVVTEPPGLNCGT